MTEDLLKNDSGKKLHIKYSGNKRIYMSILTRKFSLIDLEAMVSLGFFFTNLFNVILKKEVNSILKTYQKKLRNLAGNTLLLFQPYDVVKIGQKIS